MPVVAVATAVVTVTTVSPAVTDRDEDAARQELKTYECQKQRSDESDSPLWHDSSP